MPTWAKEFRGVENFMSDPTLQLAKRIPELLREHPEHRFKARELAELLLRRFPKACAAKLARSTALETEDQLVQQIVAEIGAQRRQIQQRRDMRESW